MKKLLLIIIATLGYISAFCAEPGTNVGITLSSLRLNFPNLKKIKSDYQGDHYHDGEDPTEGVNCFFIVKNNTVIEECVMVQDTNGFPLQWWRKVCDKFYNEHEYQDVIPKPGHYKFYYSYFTIDHIYIDNSSVKIQATAPK